MTWPFEFDTQIELEPRRHRENQNKNYRNWRQKTKNTLSALRQENPMLKETNSNLKVGSDILRIVNLSIQHFYLMRGWLTQGYLETDVKFEIWSCNAYKGT